VTVSGDPLKIPSLTPTDDAKMGGNHIVLSMWHLTLVIGRWGSGLLSE